MGACSASVCVAMRAALLVLVIAAFLESVAGVTWTRQLEGLASDEFPTRDDEIYQHEKQRHARRATVRASVSAERREGRDEASMHSTFEPTHTPTKTPTLLPTTLPPTKEPVQPPAFPPRPRNYMKPGIFFEIENGRKVRDPYVQVYGMGFTGRSLGKQEAVK